MDVAVVGSDVRATTGDICRRGINQLRSILGSDHAPIGPTTAAQRALMTVDQLIRRNIEIQLWQEQIDLDLLEDDDVVIDEDEQDDLLEESDEIEALLEEKFSISGGGRVWIQPAVAEAASVARRLGAETDFHPTKTADATLVQILQPKPAIAAAPPPNTDGEVAPPSANSESEIAATSASEVAPPTAISDSKVAPPSKRKSKWIDKLNEAAAARAPPDAVWTRGVLAQAAREYEALEEAGRRRAQKRRRRSSTSTVTKAVEDYTWRLGQIWLRLPGDCRLQAGSVRVDFGARRLIIESVADDDARYEFDAGEEFGLWRPLGALRVLCSAGLAQVDTALEEASTDSRLLRIAIVVRRALWDWPAHMRQTNNRKALQTVLQCCDAAGTATYDLDEYAVQPFIDPADLTVAWLYDALTPALSAPIIHIPNEIRTCPSRYQLAAVRWMIDRERDPGHHPDPCWSRYEIASPDAAADDHDAALWYDVVHGAFMTAERPVADLQVPRGGILADQMGLGKTLECMMLIVANRRDPSECNLPVACNDGTHRISCATTLVVVPSNLAAQWSREIAIHCPSLKTSTYVHGAMAAEEMAVLDVVITTFDVLRQEVNYSKQVPYTLRPEKKYAIPTTPLLELEFARLICDEAQQLESSVSSTAQMALRIAAKARWCVTGTPIGPRQLEDIRALFVMIGYDPYSLRNVFRDLLEDQWLLGNPQPVLDILRRIFWRHSQTSVAAELRLPPITHHDVRLRFSSVEIEYYRRLLAETRNKVQDDERAGVLGSLPLTRHLEPLRQACCHPLRAGSGLETTAHTMTQLSSNLCKLAMDDLLAAERDFCRAGNALGAFLAARGELDRAWDMLRSSWYLAESGFEAVPDRDRLKLVESMDIVTANASHRVWRAIQVINCNLLIAVGEKLTDPSPTLQESLTLLRKQRETYEAEYLESPLERIADTVDLIRDYLGRVFDLHLPTASDDARAIVERVRAAPDEPLPMAIMTEIGVLDRRYLKRRQKVMGRLRLQQLWLYQSFCQNVVRHCESHLGRAHRACMEAIRNRFSPGRQQVLDPKRPTVLTLMTRDMKRLEKALSKVKFVGLSPVEEAELATEHQMLHSNSKLFNIAREIHKLRQRLAEMRSDIDYQKKVEIEIPSMILTELPPDPDRIEQELLEKFDEQRIRCVSSLGHIRYLKHRLREGGRTDEDVCAICLQSVSELVYTVCFHVFCRLCIYASLEKQRSRGRCPCCRHPISIKHLYRVRIQDGVDALQQVENVDGVIRSMMSCPIEDPGNLSSKIAAVVRSVVWLSSQSDSTKILVFSHFKAILVLISKALDDNLVPHRLLTGSSKGRSQAIELFQDPCNMSVRALLMSMRSDASGLTLHAAQYVFLVEPSLNPALEDQSVARVHRRGQTRDTFVIRFLIEGSIEDRIIDIQQQRRQLNEERQRTDDRCHEDVSLPELLKVLAE